MKASSAFSKPILSMLLGRTSNVSATSWSTSSRIEADGAPRVVTGFVSASKTLTKSLKMGKSVMGRCAVTTRRRMLCVKGKETNWACNSFRAGCHSKASEESLLLALPLNTCWKLLQLLLRMTFWFAQVGEKTPALARSIWKRSIKNGTKSQTVKEVGHMCNR